MLSPVLQSLLSALRRLPGVGPKTAQRWVFHLLQRDRQAAALLCERLTEALAKVRQCTQCRMLCETERCSICEDPKRNAAVLCVVTSPQEVWAIEKTGTFKGMYFILNGCLSPIEGRGPHEIGLPAFQARLEEGVAEIILALSPSVEGEATAYYIAELVKDLSIVVTRIAFGVPLGGDLEWVDTPTLSLALSQRTSWQAQESLEL